MKKIVAFILTLVMIFSLAACGGDKKETETVKESQKLDYANMTADDLLKDIKDQKNVTLDEFAALVSTYSYVTITDDLELEENITTEAIEKLKENGAKLIVCGCLPQRYKEEVEKLLPEVDRFISISEYSDIAKIINQVIDSKYDFEKYDFNNRIYSTPNYMRYVKISEGCLNHCAFCAIPLIRGRLKSRTIESIVSEVKMHVNDGVYEINLISQDTTKYGFDLYNKLMLVELLKQIVMIPGDFKVRLL